MYFCHISACLASEEKTMRVGSIVVLKRALLGNARGAKGICYEEYDVGIRPAGHSFIFENGRYDGFDHIEQEELLEEVGFSGDLSGYKFANVIRLSDHFKAGVFDVVLGINNTRNNTNITWRDTT